MFTGSWANIIFFWKLFVEKILTGKYSMYFFIWIPGFSTPPHFQMILASKTQKNTEKTLL